MQPPTCSVYEEAKSTVSLQPNSTLEELQLTKHCRIRPDCFCLKWETPVLSQCGPAAFWGRIDHPSNGLDSEGLKPLGDAIAELPGALCRRSGVWPLPRHLPQASGFSGICPKVSSCQYSTCPPAKAWEPNASTAGCSKNYPGQGGELCRKENSASL